MLKRALFLSQWRALLQVVLRLSTCKSLSMTPFGRPRGSMLSNGGFSLTRWGGKDENLKYKQLRTRRRIGAIYRSAVTVFVSLITVSHLLHDCLCCTPVFLATACLLALQSRCGRPEDDAFIQASRRWLQCGDLIKIASAS